MFTTLLTDIGRKIKKIKSEEITKFNLKGPHVSCVYYLYLNGSMTSKELSDVSEEDKASVSRSLEYLESHGFIYCSSTNKKRYRAPFYLSPKGLEVGEYIEKRIASYLQKASEGISDEMRKNMYESLIKINKNLENILIK